MKVDEDTLYIVEKRRHSAISNPNNTAMKAAISDKSDISIGTNDIDEEVRKNFELKSKMSSNDDLQAEASEASDNQDFFEAKPTQKEMGPQNATMHDQEDDMTLSRTRLTSQQLDYGYEFLRLNLIELIEDLKQSIAASNQKGLTSPQWVFIFF
jgi:hypothetical protein